MIDTGAGNLVLGFAASGTSLSGSGTLGLGSVGQVKGTFAVAHDAGLLPGDPSDDTLQITATGVSATIAAGVAALGLTGASGPVRPHGRRRIGHRGRGR